MPAVLRFAPGARAEYHEALRYYATEAGTLEVAQRFLETVESSLGAICAAPELWRVIEPPLVRRYVLRRFPFVIYYCHEPAQNLVIIYALMHTSRRPGYWRGRLPY